MNPTNPGFPASDSGYGMVISLGEAPPSDASGVPDAGGTRVRTRVTYNERCISRLMAVYEQNRLPVHEVKQQLALELGYDILQIDSWFRNR